MRIANFALIAHISALALFCTLLLLPAPKPAQAQSLIPDPLFQAVDNALNDVTRARNLYNKAVSAGDEEAAAEARDAVNKAESDLGEAEANLDQERIAALSEASGVSEADIQAMRESGMGWGVIAKEIGLHPSAVARSGKGQGKGQSKDKSNKGKGKGKGKK